MARALLTLVAVLSAVAAQEGGSGGECVGSNGGPCNVDELTAYCSGFEYQENLCNSQVRCQYEEDGGCVPDMQQDVPCETYDYKMAECNAQAKCWYDNDNGSCLAAQPEPPAVDIGKFIPTVGLVPGCASVHYYTEQLLSRMACAAACLAEPECVAFEYHGSEGTCYRSSECTTASIIDQLDRYVKQGDEPSFGAGSVHEKKFDKALATDQTETEQFAVVYYQKMETCEDAFCGLTCDVTTCVEENICRPAAGSALSEQQCLDRYMVLGTKDSCEGSDGECAYYGVADPYYELTIESSQLQWGYYAATQISGDAVQVTFKDWERPEQFAVEAASQRRRLASVSRQQERLKELTAKWQDEPQEEGGRRRLQNNIRLLSHPRNVDILKETAVSDTSGKETNVCRLEYEIVCYNDQTKELERECMDYFYGDWLDCEVLRAL